MDAAINATSLNADKINGSVVAVRKPKYFYAKICGAIVDLYQAETSFSKFDEIALYAKPRKIRKSVFMANFTPSFCNNGDDGIYYKTPVPCHAVKMTEQFYLDTFGDEPSIAYGSVGDYLITRASGINEIIKADDFNNDFILINK
jgi:hypothetical protein